MSGEIQLGRIYKRKEEENKRHDIFFPKYIVPNKISQPDNVVDYLRYGYFDVERGKQNITYMTPEDIESMYDLVENE